MSRTRLMLFVAIVALLLPTMAVSAQGGPPAICSPIQASIDYIAQGVAQCGSAYDSEDECWNSYLDGTDDTYYDIDSLCADDESCSNACYDALESCWSANDDSWDCDVTYTQCIFNHFECFGDWCGFGDARLDQFTCAAPVAIFCNGDAVDVYALGAEGGSKLMTVELSTEVPAENTLLAEQDGVAVYALFNGEYQLNAGDYTLVWSGCPSTNTYVIK